MLTESSAWRKLVIFLTLLFFSFGPVSEIVYCGVDNDQDLAVVTVNLKGLVVMLMMIMLQDPF